jgi:hypothetical protein
LNISTHPFSLSGPSESDPSDRSGGESDREGSAASSNESELPDTVMRRRIQQIIGTAWILRGEITKKMLNNDSVQASMDGDADYDAKVQNTKSQTQAALGPKFENLSQKMRLNVRYFYVLATLSISCILCLLQHKSRFKSRVSSHCEKPRHWRR